MGQVDNTIVVFTTDNGAEAISFPDGGVTPFKGQKGEAYEGGYCVPCVIRWPDHIKPGTLFTEMFAALDWLPTFVELAGGPKGDGLKAQIEEGAYPGIRNTTVDGINQVPYLTGNRRNRHEKFSITSRARRRQLSAKRTGRCTTLCRSRDRRAGSCLWRRSTSLECKTSGAILREGGRH